MNKDIITYNNNGQPHGYIILYYQNGNINYRGTYKNGKEIGYEEWYYKKQTNFYIR
jgi:antitoxin component YwqK of YwqJK toxin-antitoxin module